jgi:hypothetical protein
LRGCGDFALGSLRVGGYDHDNLRASPRRFLAARPRTLMPATP